MEAPTRARILLAGLLLKFGTGGYLRISGFLGRGSLFFLIAVSFIGMIVGGFCCMLQSDLKALAAFSSINHMSFLLLVFLITSVLGGVGSLLIMVSHGFISTLMFFFIGDFYHKRLTRNFFFFGGYFYLDFALLSCFLLVFLFNRGVPLSISFFGEFFGISVILFFCFYAFFFVFLYFFNSFYYSMYLLVAGFLSKTAPSCFCVGYALGWLLLIFNINIFVFFLFF